VTAWVLRDADTGQLLGRLLAKTEEGAKELAGEFWPKSKRFTVVTAEQEDDPFS
jgi:hypothetical protein